MVLVSWDAGPTPNNADRRTVSACTFKSDTTYAAFADLRHNFAFSCQRTLAMRAAGVEGLEKAAAEADVAITRAAVNLMVGVVMDGSKIGH